MKYIYIIKYHGLKLTRFLNWDGKRLTVFFSLKTIKRRQAEGITSVIHRRDRDRDGDEIQKEIEIEMI